jgi:hypothetical protein
MLPGVHPGQEYGGDFLMAADKNAKPCCAEKTVLIAESIPSCEQASLDTAGSTTCCGASELASLESGPTLYSSLSKAHWVKGFIDTPSGKVPLVSASLAFRDVFGGWKARWGINRMRYIVRPGLYGVGKPDSTSPVLVTANYKMSFDRLRKELTGLNVWIMVLDTKGINVWCAAGKGTFGTVELVKRIAMVGLSRVVSHHTIILPQLGAPGVAAHEVRKQSGFNVVYGPVRAADIKSFLKANMKATREMRRVTFGCLDRLVLTPIELVGILKPLAIITAALLIVAATGLVEVSFSGIYPFIGAILTGAVVGPALLPWIPGSAFSWKGWLVGLIWATAVIFLEGYLVEPGTIWNILALLLVLPAISAFLTLNFTGASTYTSLSGVKREMRFSVPAIIILAVAGIGSWLVGRI